MAQGETETLKCLLLTFPRWEQGERGDSLQKELSEKPQRNACKGEPAAKGNRPKVILLRFLRIMYMEERFYWFAALLSSFPNEML